MKTSLFDIMDTSTYSREQLLQMLEIFYYLLQERAVNVQLQPAPIPFTVPNITMPYVSPVIPYVYNNGNGTICTGDTAQDHCQANMCQET